MYMNNWLNKNILLLYTGVKTPYPVLPVTIYVQTKLTSSRLIGYVAPHRVSSTLACLLVTQRDTQAFLAYRAALCSPFLMQLLTTHGFLESAMLCAFFFPVVWACVFSRSSRLLFPVVWAVHFTQSYMFTPFPSGGHKVHFIENYGNSLSRQILRRSWLHPGPHTVYLTMSVYHVY